MAMNPFGIAGWLYGRYKILYVINLIPEILLFLKLIGG